jgi:hypothetical protein
MSEERFEIELVAYLLRVGKRGWCEAHGKRNLPPRTADNSPLQKLVEHAIALAKLSDTPELREAAIDAAAVRPQYKIMEWVGDFEPDAPQRMFEFGQTL